MHNNDNDDGRPSASVITFPAGPDFMADLMADAAKERAKLGDWIDEGARDLRGVAIDEAEGDMDVAMHLLLRAIELTDEVRMVKKSLRILGPRRMGADGFPPQAA